MTFLAGSLALQPRGGAIQLSETLFQLRSGLREHLPVYTHSPDQPRGLAVESIMAVDDRSFYMEGWVRDEEADIVRITAVSPEGDRAQLAGNLYLFRRPDVSDFFSAGVLSRKETNEKRRLHLVLRAGVTELSEHRAGCWRWRTPRETCWRRAARRCCVTRRRPASASSTTSGASGFPTTT